MKRKILLAFSALSSSLLLGISIVLACGGGDWEDYAYSSFFAPEVSHEETYYPFFRSFHTLYTGTNKYDNTEDFNNANVDEWSSFFNKSIPDNELRNWLYKSRIGEVDSLIFFLKDPKYQAKNYLKNNSLAKYSDKAAAIDFLYYLGFAKRCEPYAIHTNYWWSDQAKMDSFTRARQEGVKPLLTGGEKAMLRMKRPFIKERYLFQLVRLYFLNGDYALCNAFYNKYDTVFTQSPNMKYRSLGYVAGANRGLGNIAVSNYLFSKVYDGNDVLKESAYFGFRPQEESDWQQTLAMAKNTREKTVLWQLLGIYHDPLRAMKEIYVLDPKSDLLNLLLMRAVNIAEEDFIPLDNAFDFWSDEDQKKPEPKPFEKYAITKQNVPEDLLQFVQKVADKGNTQKPYLWNLAAGYLQVAKGIYKPGQKYLELAEKQSGKDSMVATQIRIIKTVGKIEQQEKLTSNFENEITPMLRQIQSAEGESGTLRKYNSYIWSLERLAEKYLAIGDTLKAQCLRSGSVPGFYGDNRNLDKMIAFINKPDKTSFETFLAEIHPYKVIHLREVQAVNLMYEYRFADAINKFKEGALNNELYGDPFIIHNIDCHDCDHAAPKKITYTKRSFAEKMLQFENQVKANPANAANIYFELANGFYNMTYFGNARVLYYTEIGMSDFWDDYTWYPDYEDEKPRSPFYDCSKAEEYYLKARDASNNTEFKAKCTFMAAKCEMNDGYPDFKPDFKKVDFIAGKYFRELKSQFSNTQYYKEILRECSYFKTYARK